MKKKRLFVGFITAILLLFSISVISAGGNQEASDSKGMGPIEISFWSLFTGGDGEFFDAMVQEFNQTHNDIQMKADTVKYDNYYTKLTTSLTAGNAPDVVVIHRDHLLDYVSKGVLYPLNDLMNSVNAPLDDFVPAALEGCEFEGELYSLPLDVHALIMYYNKDLFAQAGITEIPETYDEVINAAEMIQDKTGKIGLSVDNTTATYKAYTLTRLFMSFLEQQDISILSDDLSQANFNNQKGEIALQGLIDTVQKYKVTPTGLDYDSAVSAFNLGNAGIHFNGVWATGGFEKQSGLNFGAVRLPAMFGKPAAWSGSHTLAVPKQKEMDQEKLNGAAEFMLWMTGRGDLWAKAGHIPTRRSVYSNANFQALPYRKDYADAAEHSFPAPRTAAWSEVYSNMSDALELAVATNQDAKEALVQMEQMVNDILSSY